MTKKKSKNKFNAERMFKKYLRDVFGGNPDEFICDDCQLNIKDAYFAGIMDFLN